MLLQCNQWEQDSKIAFKFSHTAEKAAKKKYIALKSAIRQNTIVKERRDKTSANGKKIQKQQGRLSGLEQVVFLSKILWTLILG